MDEKSHHLKSQKVSASVNKKELARGVILILLFAVLIYAGTVFIGLDNIRDKVNRAGIFGPLIFVLLKASAIIFAPLGAQPLYLVAEPLFGFTKGFIYLFLADIFAYTVVFYISRIFGKVVMKRLLSNKGMQYVDGLLHRLGTWQGFTYTRLLFFIFPELPSYVAGLTPLPFWQYILVSIPLTIINIIVLMAAGKALTNQTIIILVIASLICVTLIFLVLRFFRKNRTSGHI